MSFRLTNFFLHVRGPLFKIPCLMDAASFTVMVHKQTKILESILTTRYLEKQQNLASSALEESIKERCREDCLPLLQLRQKDVDQLVKEKHGLKHEFLVTCLVPYQLAANIIINRLPVAIRRECIAELKKQEEEIKQHNVKKSHQSNEWIEWHEEDVFVSTGVKYLNRIDSRPKRRIPVFSIMGHINHGKTSLVDALQASQVSVSEPHGITQNIRAFTLKRPLGAVNVNEPISEEYFTFIDSPGHRVFVESRLHTQVISDCIVLVVCVLEGVQSQTQEVIKVALNADKPIIVALNKLDLLSDPLTAKQRVQRVLVDLKAVGLDVSLIHTEDELLRQTRTAAKSPSPSSSSPSSPSSSSCSTTTTAAPPCRRSNAPTSSCGLSAHLLPMKKVDPSFKGSMFKPLVNLQRKCFGVCISATQGVNLTLLWHVLGLWYETANPTCRNNTIKATEANCAVQAVVLESSKHLFDEEGFRLNKRRQYLQSRLDRAKSSSKKNRQQSRRSFPRAHADPITQAARSQAKRSNRTSTSSLVITVIVREGVVTEGMHFVADQSEGRVDCMMDYWGNRVKEATPGMAVTLVDMHSVSGCPGVGIHVLSMVNEASRLRVYEHRRRLQWFVESFPTKLHLLKPRGMNTNYAHLGDYGQLHATEYLPFQLLYGPPKRKDDNNKNNNPILDGAREKSIGEYLAEANAADEGRNKLVALGNNDNNNIIINNHNHTLVAAAAAAVETTEKRTGQGIFPSGEAEVLDSVWQNLQPQKRISTQAEYEMFLQQCIHLGVLLKVDSWHAARMFTREIPRLGTHKVAVHVVGARFGPLTAEDIQFFCQSAKVIICYRTPYEPSSEIDQYVKLLDQWVLHTDHFADVLAFVKWCAVTTHREKAPNDEDFSIASEDRNYVVVDATKKKEGGGDGGDNDNDDEKKKKKDRSSSSQRRKGPRLLVYRPEDE